MLAVQTFAFRSGAARESAEIGEAFLHGRPGRSTGRPAGDHRLQRGVRLGQGRRAARGLQAFRRAADLGFADLTAVDSDDDIAPLRPLPGYDEARQQIRSARSPWPTGRGPLSAKRTG